MNDFSRTKIQVKDLLSAKVPNLEVLPIQEAAACGVLDRRLAP